MRLSESLIDALIPERKGFISITGGGGKTTLLSLVAAALKEEDVSVLLTTTTKVASPYLHDYKADRIFSDETVLVHVPQKGEVAFYAERHTLDMKKWIAPRSEVLSALAERYDVIISEADGSRGLPLKIHTERDPVIHPLTTAVIAVMGLWGMGEKAYSVTFGEERDMVVDSDYLQWYLDDPEGLAKAFCTDNAIVFNGAENADASLFEMLKTLKYPAHTAVFAASELEDKIYGIIC